MDTKITVDSGALQADEDTEVDGRPTWFWNLTEQGRREGWVHVACLTAAVSDENRPGSDDERPRIEVRLQAIELNT